MRFRPCIDLHQGKVKQIVGSTLTDNKEDTPTTNFQTEKPAQWFSKLYRRDSLTGGHIIQLGPGNEATAESALEAWPQGMQIGGGINIDNAKKWLDAGASAVIVTSWVFHDGKTDYDRLKKLVKTIGKKRLVLDLSCRRQNDCYKVVTDRWQTFTDEIVRPSLLTYLSNFCYEFLIHAVDVEGKCQGIERPLVELLGKWAGLPITYAGGIRTKDDISMIEALGNGHLDFTVGSALDIFGGDHLKYEDLAKDFAG